MRVSSSFILRPCKQVLTGNEDYRRRTAENYRRRTHCDLITGMPEHGNEKENKTGNEVTCMVDKLLVHRNAINLTSGVCDIS